MAIDTAEKRRAVANIHHRTSPGVTPNSGKDAEWRQQAGWGYSGIAAEVPADGGAPARSTPIFIGVLIGI